MGIATTTTRGADRSTARVGSRAPAPPSSSIRRGIGPLLRWVWSLLFYAAVCILVLGVLLAMDWGFQLQLVVGVSALASYVGFRVGVAEGRIAEQIRESERRYHELRRRLFAADSPGEVDDARGAVPRLEDDGDSLSPNSEP